MANASVYRHKIGGCADAFDFLLAFAKRISSNERPKAVTGLRKTRRDRAAAIVSLLCLAILAMLAGGCADPYYLDAKHTPEARYDTYYAPHYYPYYPWYAYYGGAYYYGE